MEEYHRDSLRELRRMERQEAEHPPKNKGSGWITLLIVLMFLAAGGFYFKTARPELFQKYYDTLKNWADEAVSVFQQEKPNDVQQTVDEALAKQNETV